MIVVKWTKETDPKPVNPSGADYPRRLKQDFGITASVYQTTGPLRLALDYFRVKHQLYK